FAIRRERDRECTRMPIEPSHLGAGIGVREDYFFALTADREQGVVGGERATNGIAESVLDQMPSRACLKIPNADLIGIVTTEITPKRCDQSLIPGEDQSAGGVLSLESANQSSGGRVVKQYARNVVDADGYPFTVRQTLETQRDTLLIAGF